MCPQGRQWSQVRGVSRQRLDCASAPPTLTDTFHHSLVSPLVFLLLTILLLLACVTAVVSWINVQWGDAPIVLTAENRRRAPTFPAVHAWRSPAAPASLQARVRSPNPSMNEVQRVSSRRSAFTAVSGTVGSSSFETKPAIRGADVAFVQREVTDDTLCTICLAALSELCGACEPHKGRNMNCLVVTGRCGTLWMESCMHVQWV